MELWRSAVVAWVVWLAGSMFGFVTLGTGEDGRDSGGGAE